MRSPLGNDHFATLKRRERAEASVLSRPRVVERRLSLSRRVERQRHDMHRSSLLIIALVMLLLVTGLAPVCTAQRPSTSASSAANATGPQNVTELASFLNTTITEQLAADHIAGATVAVVKDGRLFYTHGYGYADVEHKTPVDANTTMFEIGSVTKLFTWTAVMQLVQQGKINLHADVNTYLKDFKLPATYPQPITMEHLMTHTAGFEGSDLSPGLAVSDPKDLQPLSTVLAQTIPARVWPPGQVWSYSNWGAALAGYIVQEVSGEPFNQYVQHHIFTPLGMHNTTIEQPVPGPLAANTATGYAYSDGTFIKQPSFTILMPPAGAIRSTAPDMAKFMLAHLNNGTYNNTHILSAAAAEDMHSSHFNPDHYTKFGLGFVIGNQNNESSISHTGGTLSFNTLCILWPARNVGLFASYSSPGGALAVSDLQTKFLDHYYPYTPIPPQPRNFNDAPSVTGTYQSTRTVYTTAVKYFASLISPSTADVTGNPNGTVTTAVSGQQLNLVEVAPLVFTPQGNVTPLLQGAHFIFTTGSNGTYFHPDAAPQYYERLPWYATPAGITNLGYLCLAVFLSAAIWPVGALHGRWRRWRGRTAETMTSTRTRLPSLAHWVIGIVAVLYWLVFLIPFLLVLALGQNIQFLLWSLTIPPPIVAWLTLPLIAIPLTVVGVILAVLAWTRRYWTTFGRIHYTVVVGAAVAFIAWLNYWNLIGFRW